MHSVYSFLCFIFMLFIAPSLQEPFPAGTERSYTFSDETFLSDNKFSTLRGGVRFTATVRVASIYSDNADARLLRFNLQSPQFSTQSQKRPNKFIDRTSGYEAVKLHPVYAEWDAGKIGTVYFSKNEQLSMVNLKNAIVSLFQYQLTDDEFTEEDISGNCTVRYRSKSSTKYEKIKENCKTSALKNHTRIELPLSVRAEPTRLSEFVVTGDGTLQKVGSTESFQIGLALDNKSGVKLENLLKLSFDGSISDAKQFETKQDAIDSFGDYQELSLESYATHEEAVHNFPNMKQAIKFLKPELTNEKVGKLEAAECLISILPLARSAKSDELVQILNAHTTKELKPQLLDILAATQTKNSHNAVKASLQFNKTENFDNVERYLQSLAIGTRPQKTVLADLFEVLSTNAIDNPKLTDTMVQTVASMALRFAQLPGQCFDSKIVKKIFKYLLTTLESCKDDICKEMYIRALQNLQSSDAIENLILYALNGEKIVSVAAMKALRSFPTSYWKDEHKKQFTTIFFQKSKKFDSSARTLSLDILLEMRPTQLELKALLEYLKTKDPAFEVKQYLLQKLRMLSMQCSRFRNAIQSILFEDQSLNNYHIQGQRGMTTVLGRQFSKEPSFNASLLSVQEIQNGVLKRGVVDMTLEVNREKFSMFTLGLYAGGLGSFVGGSDDPDEVDSSPATAGMELTVQGSRLRPLEFFNGQGELMGHVWSGTASDSTPAYTATTLLHDHEGVLKLQNGIVVNLAVLGAVSIDLNGKVQTSLWNRNAQCEVVQNSGIVFNGKVNLQNTFFSMELEFTSTQEPNLQLTADIDFSGDAMLCMKLQQPDTILRQSSTMRQKISTSNYGWKQTNTRKYRIPGITHALNQKNNDMCTELHKS